jgi:hypothetical protein
VKLSTIQMLEDDWHDVQPGYSFIDHSKNAEVLQGWDI